MMRCGQDRRRRHTPVRLRSENHFSVTSISQQRKEKVMVQNLVEEILLFNIVFICATGVPYCMIITNSNKLYSTYISMINF